MLAIREESEQNVTWGSPITDGDTPAINRNPRLPKIIFVFMYSLIATQHHACINSAFDGTSIIVLQNITKFTNISIKVSTEQIRPSILEK